MKTDAKNFKDFLTKATLNGTITQMLLKIENKKLYSAMRSTDTVCAVQAKLKNVDSEDVVWGIKDTKLLIKCLDLFSGTIELKQESNKLYIFNKEKQVEMVLTEESYIDNVMKKTLDLKFEKSVVIPTAIFKNAVKNRETIDGEKITIESNEKQIIVMTGSKNFDTIKETMNVPYISAKVSFAAGFSDIMRVVGDKAEVSLKTDYPAQFREDTTEYEIIYLIAPTVANEEGE